MKWFDKNKLVNPTNDNITMMENSVVYRAFHKWSLDEVNQIYESNQQQKTATSVAKAYEIQETVYLTKPITYVKYEEFGIEWKYISVVHSFISPSRNLTDSKVEFSFLVLAHNVN